MKIKKMVGALALSAALAMGVTPAFAAGTVDVDGTNNEFSDNGSTTIKGKVDVYNASVRATVPLQVTVVFGNEGEQEIIGPRAEAYYIDNIGDGPIFVENAEITDMNSFFSSEAWRSGATPSDKALMFFYQTDGIQTFLTTDHPLNAAKTGNTGAANTEKQLVQSWGMTPSNYVNNEDVLQPGDKLNITLGGMTYFANAISADDFTDTLCKIKYTIGSAS